MGGVMKPSTDKEDVAKAKKPYQRPELRVYGDLTAITSTGGTASMNDQHSSDKSIP
jgi:hypothetical protein